MGDIANKPAEKKKKHLGEKWNRVLHYDNNYTWEEYNKYIEIIDKTQKNNKN